jgi:hypothetical protein
MCGLRVETGFTKLSVFHVSPQDHLQNFIDTHECD